MSGIDDETRPMRERMEALIRLKQQEITSGILAVENQQFRVDEWTREKGGGGRTMVLQNGTIFEKAGVNISIVHGSLSPSAVESMRANHANLKGSGQDGSANFFACGLSIVIHGHNPHVPTVHANYRYFETSNPESGETESWWFGGGCDLTPSYLYEEDARHFHLTIKTALDTHDAALYPGWKKWCDEYFYLKHRQEGRGVGGIFFDDFDNRSPLEIFALVHLCFDAFLPSYLPIVDKRKEQEFTEQQKHWQQTRRGRYVEFNLLWDRGTQFGLKTPGSRIESILMSLPATAAWEYDFHPEPNSEEEKLVQVLKNPVDWV